MSRTPITRDDDAGRPATPGTSEASSAVSGGFAVRKRSRIGLPPALRSPAFRQYWLGTLASVTGFQILQFGQLWLIYELTSSPWFLGYVGLANALPAIALNLIGGVWADRMDKRRLIMATQIISAAMIFVLATLTATGLVQVWHILTLALVSGAVSAFNQPARQALYPHLIDRQMMMSAVALNSSIWQGTRIVAPAIAGAIIFLAETAVAFYVAGLGMLSMALVLVRMDIPPIASAGSGRTGEDLLEGVRFIKDNPIFSFLIGMTFFNSFFGMAYVMLMPVFAVDVLQVGPQGQGVLLSIGGVGSLIVTLWLGSRKEFGRKGLVMIGGAVLFGLSIAAFGLTSLYIGSYNLALLLMFVAGVFNSVYMISVMTSLQMLVPDQMRGRVMGFYGMTWSIMPLGGMQAGALAGFVGAPVAVAIGGMLVALFALGPALMNRRVRAMRPA